jgi:transposase-like protein
MVEEMLAARGIAVSHETVRQWALKFGQEFANRIRRRLPCVGDKWHLDEVVILSAKSEVLEIVMAWAATVAAAKRDQPQELASTWHSRTGCRVRIGLQG